MNWGSLNSHNWCVKTVAKKWTVGEKRRGKKSEKLQMRKWMRDGDWPQLQFADRRVFIQVYVIILGWQQYNSEWCKFSSEVCGKHICVWIGLFECMLTPENWLWDIDSSSSSSCIWQLKDLMVHITEETSIKLRGLLAMRCKLSERTDWIISVSMNRDMH